MDLGRQRGTLRDPIADFCEHMHFTPPQLHALVWLGRSDALTMGELAGRVGVTEKTITGVVDRLEAAGVVARDRDADDRRVVLVRLTGEGRTTFSKLDGEMRERIGALLALLSDTDRNALFRILENLAERMGSAAPPEEAGIAGRRAERASTEHPKEKP